MTNTDKLNGLLREKGFSQQKMAQNLRLSNNSFRLKLYNKNEFKASEISTMIDLLHIDKLEDIKHIFFTKVVDNLSTNKSA